MRFEYLTLLGAIGSAIAQRPSDVSICDYYTTALLKENTGANQYALLTLVVNTALIGNYTTPNVGVAVTGILNPGEYKGVPVNLLGYFNGGFVSTNNNGMPSVMTFLDGGGAAALLQSLPAFDNTSNQYFLLTHLYEYFGLLLGCSQVGKAGFPPYGGDPSMYDVHKYMALDANQLGYFITQVGLSAASFGVAEADVTIVGNALISFFDYRCLAPTTIVPGQGPQLNSICDAESCPLAPQNASCSLYDLDNGSSPQPAAYSQFTSSPKPTATSCPKAATSTVVVTSTVSGVCPASSAPQSIVTSYKASPPPASSAPQSIVTSYKASPPPAPPASSAHSSPGAPSPPPSSCPTGLTGNYQFPHLIVPISSANPDTAYGTSYDATISATVSTIFDFDIPASYAGATCALVFLFPDQSELTTSSYTFSGNGAIAFSALSSPATWSTDYANAPSVAQRIGTVTVAPGHSYTLATYPCPAGERVAIEASAVGDTSLEYFQDYNPSPIGLYIVQC